MSGRRGSAKPNKSFSKYHESTNLTDRRCQDPGPRVEFGKSGLGAGEAAVIAAGHQARALAVEVAQQWHNHRLAVALVLVEATYSHQPGGNPEHLARRSKNVIEAEHLTSGVAIFATDAAEIDRLRGFRAARAPVVAKHNGCAYISAYG